MKQIFYISICRSSRSEVFCKKGVLRNFANFTGKHLCQSLFFNKHCTKNEVFYWGFLQLMWPNQQFLADLITFTKEILNEKRHFLYCDSCMPQACNFIKKEALAQMFSCEFCEISKCTFFTEHIWTLLNFGTGIFKFLKFFNFLRFSSI